MVKILKRTSILSLRSHIGPAIFHCNMGEETSSIAHHVALHTLFLAEVIESWQLLPIADNSWLNLKKKTPFLPLISQLPEKLVIIMCNKFFKLSDFLRKWLSSIFFND